MLERKKETKRQFGTIYWSNPRWESPSVCFTCLIFTSFPSAAQLSQWRGSVVVNKILVSSAKCPTSTAVVADKWSSWVLHQYYIYIHASCFSLLIRLALISSYLHIVNEHTVTSNDPHALQSEPKWSSGLLLAFSPPSWCFSVVISNNGHFKDMAQKKINGITSLEDFSCYFLQMLLIFSFHSITIVSQQYKCGVARLNVLTFHFLYIEFK